MVLNLELGPLLLVVFWYFHGIRLLGGFGLILEIFVVLTDWVFVYRV
jgi:hypothetical protein